MGALLLAGLGLVSLPVILEQRKLTDRLRATHNAWEMHLALLDFDGEYGRYPDASTIPLVKANTRTTLALGTTTSNDFFRQLIAAGSSSEKIFWAKTSSSTRKPDDILGADALAKGECSYSYIAGLSSKDDPNTPVVVTPMIPGTSKFDPEPFMNSAVVLRIDGSARPELIDKNGHVMIGGMNLFDPRQPFWHGKAPDLKWPE